MSHCYIFLRYLENQYWLSTDFGNGTGITAISFDDVSSGTVATNIVRSGANALPFAGGLVCGFRTKH